MCRKSAFLAAFALLAACDTAGRGYMGLPAVRAEAGGHVFDVRRRGDEAEAVRRNVAALPTFDAVARAAEVAIERATGCDALTLEGDPSLLRAELDCPD